MANKLVNFQSSLKFYLNKEVEMLDYSIINNELHITLLQRTKATFITFIITNNNQPTNIDVKYFNINNYQFQIDLIEHIIAYINQNQWTKITCELMNDLREVNVLINSHQQIYLDNIYECFNIKNKINFYLYDAITNQESYINQTLNQNLKKQYSLALIRKSENNNVVTNPVVDKLINYFLTYIPIYFYNKPKNQKQIKIFQM